MSAKPVTGLTTFGASTSGTTTQLDNNFTAITGVVNDLNTYANYLVDSGASNAYAVTLAANLTGALTAGLIIQVKIGNGNTGASTMNYNGTGAIPIVDLNGAALANNAMPAGAIVQMQYSSALASWILQTPYSAAASTSVFVPVRQTVLSGPIASSGAPTLLPASCTSLTVVASNANSTVPIVVTAARGFSTSGANDVVSYTTGNLTWNCTANAVNFLGVVCEANGTLSTVVVSNANGVMPVYQWAGSATNGNGNYTFNIQEMKMYLGNGTATAQNSTVFVGEANCNSNAAVTIVNYAYMARYRSAVTATLTGTATQTSFSHNLGVDANHVRAIPKAWGICTTADNGWSPNAVMELSPTASGAALPFPAAANTDRNTAIMQSGSGGTGWSGISRTAGGQFNLTAASWSYFLTAERGW